MVLKLAASLRTSPGPLLTSDRVSSAPSPSRRAAAARELSGRLTQRASAIATSAPTRRPAADTAPSHAHRASSRRPSGPAGRDRATAPRPWWPSSLRTGASTSSRLPAVRTMVVSLDRTLRITPGATGGPAPAIRRPAAAVDRDLVTVAAELRHRSGQRGPALVVAELLLGHAGQRPRGADGLIPEVLAVVLGRDQAERDDDGAEQGADDREDRQHDPAGHQMSLSRKPRP